MHLFLKQTGALLCEKKILGHVWTVKAQINLHICAVWLELTLSAYSIMLPYYPKNWDIFTPYHSCPKILSTVFDLITTPCT